MEIRSRYLKKALHNFMAEMDRRLAEKECIGWTGWSGGFPTKLILLDMKKKMANINLLNEYDIRKDCVDLANFAMMLWYRENKTRGLKKTGGQ